ncbi:hypothetical protein UPYG_G00221510 [Umbra pygmaea]|uniref:Uncharacterized protein n=1 Tax=Umbra pygmaea TaxID=75934 RepID=A0ABD0WBK4_UMBPY
MEKPFVFAYEDLAQTGLEPNDAEVDSGFGDWTTVCNSTKSETLERSYGVEQNPWVVFQQCFPGVQSKQTNYTVQSLSQLLENNSACFSQPSATICDSGALWSCLVAEPSRLRLSEPMTSSHCKSRMVSALKVTHSQCICEQSVEALLKNDNEETPDETSHPSAAALIKTKLVATSSCRGETPAFLYQVSQRWLSQCSLQLQLQHHKKSTALKYGE